MNWAEAKLDAAGYDSGDIFFRARESALKVKRGEAIFERDSVCFYKEEYRWPVLACLFTIAAKRDGKLNVLDFGGALGSFYFQHNKFFKELKSIRWSVIEQPHFVECGLNEFQNENLKFYININECLSKEKVDVIFLSSVLQYLEKPNEVLKQLSESNVDYILIDRTPFIENQNDRLTVQLVPESIYKASYPAWFFSNQKFNLLVNKIGFRVFEEFDCIDEVGFGRYKGYFLERI